MGVVKFGPEIRRAAVAAYMTNEKTESICARLGLGKGTLQRFVKEAGARFRYQYNKRQQIINVSVNNPRLGPAEVARETGAHIQHVIRVRNECGLTKITQGLNGVPAPDQSSLQGLSE